MNYTLGKPYEDKSQKFFATDVTDHMIDMERPRGRMGYKFVSAGVDWGQHNHHLVILGLTTEGRIDLMDLCEISQSHGTEHIEEDISTLVAELNKYQPDIILPDIGYSANGNYIDILRKYYGLSRVYGVKVNSALSTGNPVATFNDASGVVTIDKLTQNLIMMGNMRRGDIHFWSPLDNDLKMFINHWSNVIIRTDEEEDTTTHEVKLVKRILRKNGD